ncbi:hypothetical protein D3C87_373670 [compost metagenome]
MRHYYMYFFCALKVVSSVMILGYLVIGYFVIRDGILDTGVYGVDSVVVLLFAFLFSIAMWKIGSIGLRRMRAVKD